MKKHEPITEQFISLMQDAELKSLMQKAIDKAKYKNSDPVTNPAQNLEELYDFIDWACKCLPWNVLNKKYSSLYLDINQSINFFWFLFGQRLDELKDKGYYQPTLEYHEPIASWIRDFSNAWGDFLSTEESWNDEYFKKQFEDDLFGMNNGWYAKENVYKTYNEFFSRKLISPDVRPIGDASLVSPADSEPAGVYKIKEDGYIENDGVLIKGHQVYKVDDLLGKESRYKGRFNGGTLTHTFLNVFDYHRYHFPIDGTILEMHKIKAANAVGGHTYYDEKLNLYRLDCNDTNWQMVETRDCVVMQSEYGIVACLPIGMSQICSCNFEENLKVGSSVKKGDPMGYFLFGGSDIVMLFEKDVQFELLCTPKKHLLMGENYANLKNTR